MSQHSTEFEATDGGLELTNAILLYQNGPRRTAAFASMHAVKLQEGQPTIAAGTPLTRAHLRQWTAALGRAAPPEILPDNVLVSHPDMLAWWVPEQVRTAYFALSSPAADLRALRQRTTVDLPYPAHLLVATRKGLGVYALPESKRPGAETLVLFSPVLNVFIDGRLCWGNIPQPKALTIASIAEYERAVFDSWSTHPNPGQEKTVSGKGGLVRLWDNLAARGTKRFPVKRLRPFAFSRSTRNEGAPVTVGSLIARSTHA